MNLLLAPILVLLSAPGSPIQGVADCSRGGQWISAAMTKVPRGTDYCILTYSALIPDPPGHPIRVILGRKKLKDTKKKAFLSVPDEQLDIMKNARCFEVQVDCFDQRGRRSVHIGGTVLVAK